MDPPPVLWIMTPIHNITLLPGHLPVPSIFVCESPSSILVMLWSDELGWLLLFKCHLYVFDDSVDASDCASLGLPPLSRPQIPLCTSLHVHCLSFTSRSFLDVLGTSSTWLLYFRVVSIPPVTILFILSDFSSEQETLFHSGVQNGKSNIEKLSKCV